MKKYSAPILKETLFSVEDVISLSSTVTGIVSDSDAQGTSEIQTSDWNDSWN